MKAVMSEVPETVLAWRKRTGADIWDEMWEGVLHMPPMPTRSHQDFASELEGWLREHWGRPKGNRVHREVNVASVGGWPRDHRVPDLVLLTPDRLHIDCDEYLEGPPLVIVEIHSPGDETLEKLPFYAKLGVPEVWVIDRDTKTPKIYRLAGNEYELQRAAARGWVHSAAAGVSLRATARRRLAIQLTDDASTRRTVPER